MKSLALVLVARYVNQVVPNSMILDFNAQTTQRTTIEGNHLERPSTATKVVGFSLV